MSRVRTEAGTYVITALANHAATHAVYRHLKSINYAPVLMTAGLEGCRIPA